VALDGALSYEEPWSWMQPPRHALRALLLEQGEVEEAAAVYTADLAACAAPGAPAVGGVCIVFAGRSCLAFARSG
jgi:hypothetical protein